MRHDVSGWTTRVTAEDIDRYAHSGAWRDVTLADCARQQVRMRGDRVAVIDGARSSSYAELFDDAHSLARAFRAIGLQPGQTVSFQLPNWRETMVINLAACLARLVANPIVPIYREAEVGYILKNAGSTVFFVPHAFRNYDYAAMALRLQSALPALRDIVIVRGEVAGSRTYDALLGASAAGPAPAEAVDPNAVKLLLYTSGTTGNAKGVLHSHNTIMSEIDAVIDFWGIDSNDVVLMPSPVTHITGYLYALEIAFAAGVKVVFMERWDAGQAVDLIIEHGVTFSVGATPFLKELLAETERRNVTLHSLRLFMSGGAPVPPELIYRARKQWPQCLTFRVYGSTEAPTVTLGISGAAETDLGANTDGRIVNHEVCLCDPVSGAPSASDGEICTRGPELMLGYTDWRQTREAFDADGFFHTGDLGYYVDGEYLCVSGRKKDLIIRGGENISPKEIEDVLHTHPAIKEIAIVAMPHERLQETVCAFVIPHVGATIDLASMAAFLQTAGLAKQKCPERIEIVDDLPRTASGKVQKNVLRERIAAIVKGGA